MREIKFRGLRTDGKGWVYGYYRKWFNSHNGKCVHFISNDYADTYEVIPETVGQFTSLKDKNGTEIYEGDMFAPDTDNEEVKAVVRWDEDSAKFVVDSYDSELSFCETNDLSDMILEYCEVIGNIHTTHDKGKEETR